MSFFGGSGGGGVGDTAAQMRYAQITQEMYDDYKQRYEPLEGELIDEVTDPVKYQDYVTDAGNTAERSLDQSQGIFYRTAQRNGLTLSNDMIGDYEDRFQRDKTAQIIDARNRTRTAVNDRNIGIKQGLTASGRGLASTAAGTAGSVASMETSRNQSNRARAAQDDASAMQGLGTMASIGLMLV